MVNQGWTDTLDRVGRAVWELLDAHPELNHVRAEVYVGHESDPQVLATDVAGWVLWIDEAGTNHRQVIHADGTLARDGS